jgi:RNA polymerase sigma-70 factor (ECF subfamily)
MQTTQARVPVPSAAASDLQVIAQVRAGDLKAFETLMRRYNQLLFRTVRSIARSDAEAEDVAQDAWIAAYQHLDQFEGRAAFSTWVSRIAIRMAAARTRQQLRWAALDELGGVAVQDELDDPAGSMERRELASVLERALDALPVEYRIVLVLRDVEQRSTQETAETLGLTEENVRVRLHRSRAALRELVKGELDGSLREVFAFDGQRCDRLVRGVLASLTGSPTRG